MCVTKFALHLQESVRYSGPMSEMTRARKPHTRALIVATTVLAGGIAASLAGNVQAINLDGPAGPGETISAVAWPLALFGAIEVMLHTPWIRSWRDDLTKWAGLLGAAFIALYVSYGHLQNVLEAYGYDVVSSHAGPLAIDVTMAMATLSLNRVGHQHRAWVKDRAQMDRMMADWNKAKDQSVRTLDEVDPVEVPVDMPAESWSVWNGLVDRLGGQGDPTLPVPVSPASAGSNEVKPESVPAQAAESIKVWYDTDPAGRPAPGEQDKLVAEVMGVTPRTARRWRYALKPQPTAGTTYVPAE